MKRLSRLKWLCRFKDLFLLLFCNYTKNRKTENKNIIRLLPTSRVCCCYWCRWPALLQIFEMKYDHVGTLARHVIQNKISAMDKIYLETLLARDDVVLPFIFLQNFLDFLQVIVILDVHIAALMRNQLALLKEFLEVGLCSDVLVANVIAEFTFALKILTRITTSNNK